MKYRFYALLPFIAIAGCNDSSNPQPDSVASTFESQINELKAENAGLVAENTDLVKKNEGLNLALKDARKELPNTPEAPDKQTADISSAAPSDELCK
ncbi:hypothetical protein [Phyllobacterium sp. K27]